ncbi:hypothetical protein D1007_52380 [Hordeum vulgare]|nr:hypothetical protein D1007_52380 [Hordeum vulgare]
MSSSSSCSDSDIDINEELAFRTALERSKALRLAIEQSEREAAKAAARAARVAKLKRQQDKVVRQLKGLSILFSSDSFDDDYHNASFDNSDNPPPVVDAYNNVVDRKGKRPVRKW